MNTAASHREFQQEAIKHSRGDKRQAESILSLAGDGCEQNDSEDVDRVDDRDNEEEKASKESIESQFDDEDDYDEIGSESIDHCRLLLDDEIGHHHHHHQQQQQQQQQQHFRQSQADRVSVAMQERDNQQQQQHHQHKDYDEVKQVELFGVCIVALTINGRERLCLAQISNTLLKEFSYNEIHNRRVALGITCVQCTPIQLEMLRRAGAMPSSSRRCGMITMREAERLCRSFLVEEQPPDLPENFYFTVAHKINYGCKGRFVPARYISSRAKCIECFYCGEFYSPNKFIFHSHRQPNATDCNPPDSPNINSWRKHIDLDWTQEHSQEIKYAWEDVKSLFNGGTRRRAPNGPTPSLSSSNQYASQTEHMRETPGAINNNKLPDLSDSDQLIDVDDSISFKASASNSSVASDGNNDFAQKQKLSVKHEKREFVKQRQVSDNNHQPKNNSLMLNLPTTTSSKSSGSKRSASSNHHTDMSPAVKRFSVANMQLAPGVQLARDLQVASALSRPPQPIHLNHRNNQFLVPRPPMSQAQAQFAGPYNGLQSTTASEYPTPSLTPSNTSSNNNTNNCQRMDAQSKLLYPSPAAAAAATNSSTFIYSQLYNQLIQQQQQQQQQLPHHRQQQHQLTPPNHAVVEQQQQQQQLASAAIDAQLALRHHLWSSLLANLQCNNQQTSSNQTYTQFSPTAQFGLPQANCNTVTGDSSALDALPRAAAAAANLGHLLSAQLYGSAPGQQKQQMLRPTDPLDSYKQDGHSSPGSSIFPSPSTMHLKSYPTQINDSAHSSHDA